MNTLEGNKLTGAQKEELMDQVKQQVAVLLAQELLQKITDKCFRKCITKPGSSLDNSEQYFQELKEKLTSKECIVLADFAENYTFTIQDEIRSYHWNNNQQATIN